MRRLLQWSPRFPALSPTAAAGWRESGLALLAAAAADVAAGRRLAVDRAGPLVVVRCLDASPPPWAGGVTWLGEDLELPRILMPTARRAGAPAALLGRALREQLDDDGIAVLLEHPETLVRLDGAWPCDVNALEDAASVLRWAAEGGWGEPGRPESWR